MDEKKKLEKLKDEERKVDIPVWMVTIVYACLAINALAFIVLVYFIVFLAG